MSKLAVVIPYFQRKVGVLRRTLESVVAQNLPHGLLVDVIIVDDASPIPAKQELEGLVSPSSITIRVIEQANGGVAAARNAGLKAVTEGTDYIAFLDSDDVWNENHLKFGVEALEAGYDFYFTDNSRDGYHESDFQTHEGIKAVINAASAGQKIIPIDKDLLLGLVLREFPTQASTVIYKRAIAADHFFDSGLRSAGEDLVFFVQLVSKTTSPCLCPNTMVRCCDGVNIYFGSFDWDHPKRLLIAYDQIHAFSKIISSVKLTAVDMSWMQMMLRRLKTDLVFFSLRAMIKTRKWPVQFSQLAAQMPLFPIWFPYKVLTIIFGRLTRTYKPIL